MIKQRSAGRFRGSTKNRTRGRVAYALNKTCGAYVWQRRPKTSSRTRQIGGGGGDSVVNCCHAHSHHRHCARRYGPSRCLRAAAVDCERFARRSSPRGKRSRASSFTFLSIPGLVFCACVITLYKLDSIVASNARFVL